MAELQPGLQDPAWWPVPALVASLWSQTGLQSPPPLPDPALVALLRPCSRLCLGSHRLAAGCCLAAGPAAHHTQTSWVRTAASLACASFMDLRPPLFTGALALQAFAHPPELPVLLISLLTPICNALLEILHLLYVVADVELSLHLSASA